MSKVITNRVQMEKLVSLMEVNSDLAKGVCTKQHATKKWAHITEELNSLGPPTRTVDKWIKVWTDFKSKTKKKKTQNSAEFRATGGGPNRLNTFSSLEESVVSLLDMEVVIDPPGRRFGLEEDMVVEIEDDVENVPPSNTLNIETPKTKAYNKRISKDEVMEQLLEHKKDKWETMKKWRNEEWEMKKKWRNEEWEMKKKWKEEELELRRQEVRAILRNDCK